MVEPDIWHSRSLLGELTRCIHSYTNSCPPIQKLLLRRGWDPYVEEMNIYWRQSFILQQTDACWELKLVSELNILLMTLLWLAVFRWLRKRQLPTHLRATISIEQLLGFLCHDSSHSVGRLSVLEDEPHRVISLLLCFPSFSLFTLCAGFANACKAATHLRLSCCMLSGSLASWSKLHIKVTHSFSSACHWMETVLHFLTARWTPFKNRRALAYR